MAARRFMKNTEIRRLALARASETGESFVTAWRAVITEWLADNPRSQPKKPEYPFTEKDGLPSSMHHLGGFETNRNKH